jgi:hypothetical protein
MMGSQGAGLVIVSGEPRNLTRPAGAWPTEDVLLVEVDGEATLNEMATEGCVRAEPRITACSIA